MTTPVNPAGIRIEWLVVSELEFLDNPDAAPAARKSPINVTFILGQELEDEGRSCRVTLRAEVEQAEPRRFQRLAAAVQGKFVQMGDDPTISVEEFMHKQGPVILMPFLRDAIATATVKSRHGAVLLPPMNVSAMIQNSATAEAGQE